MESQASWSERSAATGAPSMPPRTTATMTATSGRIVRVFPRRLSYPALRREWFSLREAAVFYISYIRSELLRRKSRTILTLLGLAIGVALVIVISSLSRGVDHAQKQALNPLSSIGTDLTVTLAPQTNGGGFGGGPWGGGRGQVIQANASVLTDLSKLGKAGPKVDHTFLLPGTPPAFPPSLT